MILYRGQVVQAILATIAVPGVFPPIQINDNLLIDGGGLDPVPVSVARWLMPNLPIVAVVLNEPNETVKHGGFPFPIPGPAPLVETVTRLRLTQALSIFIQSAEITSTMLTELRLQVDHPDVIIRPAVSHISLLDQVNVPDVIALGERACDEQLPAIRRAVSWPQMFSRRLKNSIGPEQNPELSQYSISGKPYHPQDGSPNKAE
jgi:NTE family protein